MTSAACSGRCDTVTEEVAAIVTNATWASSDHRVSGRNTGVAVHALSGNRIVCGQHLNWFSIVGSRKDVNCLKCLKKLQAQA